MKMTIHVKKTGIKINKEWYNAGLCQIWWCVVSICKQKNKYNIKSIWCTIGIQKSFHFLFSAHMQSVKPRVFARFCYTFCEVTLCKNEGLCVTSHMWLVVCHASWVVYHVPHDTSQLAFLITHNIMSSVNFLCLFWLYILYIKVNAIIVFHAFVCHGQWYTDGWQASGHWQ